MRSFLPVEFAEAGTLLEGVRRGERRSVLVCGMTPGDGASLIAYGLAQAARGAGLRGAYVDANPASRFSRDELCLSQDRRGPGDGLTIVTDPGLAGEDGATALRDLVADLATDHDHIVVDAPCLERRVRRFAPTVRLAHACDGVLLCVRAGRSREADVAAQIRRLEDEGATVLGTVFNDADEINLRDLKTHRLFQLLHSLWKRLSNSVTREGAA